MDRPWYWWLLVASIIIIWTLGLIGYIFFKKKAKKIRLKYYKELEKAESLKNAMNNFGKDEITGQENVLARKNLGQLLWDFDDELIKKKICHLSFMDMEFLINTIFRNKYKSFLQINSNCGYELITIGTKKKDVELYYNNIKEIDVMYEYCKKYKVPTSRIKKNDKTILKIDIILILEFKKDIVSAVELSYKILSKGGLIFISGMENRKFKKQIKQLKKFIESKNYRYEQSQSAKNIMLITK